MLAFFDIAGQIVAFLTFLIVIAMCLATIPAVKEEFGNSLPVYHQLAKLVAVIIFALIGLCWVGVQ